MKVFRSASRNVFWNLAFEDWLLKSPVAPAQALLLYRNDPCIVIGRNQNPWKECNIERAAEDRARIARRRSGGGTVYHDHGNLNYFFSNSRKGHDPDRNTRVVLDALRQLGFPVHTNARNDILLHNKKIGGAAYRLTSKRAYHHGTVLVSSDLSALSALISSSHFDQIDDRSTASVRVPVTSLSAEMNTDIEVVADRIARSYLRIQPSAPISWSELPSRRDPSIDDEVGLLRSPDWIYGKSPRFSHRLRNTFPFGSYSFDISVNRGGAIDDVLVKADASSEHVHSWKPESIRTFTSLLRGVPFDGLALAEVVAVANDKPLVEALQWLVHTVPGGTLTMRK